MTKSVTSSENSNVAVNALLELILAGTPVIATDGAAASHVAVALSALAGPRLRPSVAEFAFTSTVTFDPLVGVTTSV